MAVASAGSSATWPHFSVSPGVIVGSSLVPDRGTWYSTVETCVEPTLGGSGAGVFGVPLETTAVAALAAMTVPVAFIALTCATSVCPSSLLTG